MLGLCVPLASSCCILYIGLHIFGNTSLCISNYVLWYGFQVVFNFKYVQQDFLAFKNRKSTIVSSCLISLTSLIVPFHLSLSTWFKSLNRALSRDDPKAIISVLRLCWLRRAVSTEKQTGDQKKKAFDTEVILGNGFQNESLRSLECYKEIFQY